MINRNAKRYDLLLQEEIRSLLNQCRFQLQMLTNELKSIEKGNLYIKRSKANVWFNEYSNGKEFGITRDKQRVHALSRRKYIEMQYHYLRESYKALKELSLFLERTGKRFDSDAILREFQALHFDMNQVFLSAKEQQWMLPQQSHNDFHPEHLQHITDGGVIMRSKSERNIGNRLELWKVPYLYEFPLRLRYRLIYPDFTIQKNNGEIIYWEHFGKMNEEVYFRSNMERLREYRYQGFCEHTNLIVTWENDLHDMSIIDHIIETRICH